MDHVKNAAWIPWAIIAFFASFMLLLGSFAWIALHTYPGEATDDAYNKGLAYNHDLQSAAAQDALGWESSLQLVPQGHVVEIEFTLRDASGNPITNASIIARARRATQAGHDTQISLKTGGKGLYRGRMKLDWPGAWDIRVSATQGADNYQKSKIIVVQ